MSQQLTIKESFEKAAKHISNTQPESKKSNSSSQKKKSRYN